MYRLTFKPLISGKALRNPQGAAPIWLVRSILAFAACAGCTDRAGSIPGKTLPATVKSKVIAQGQILPAGGIVQIAASPGDVVEEGLVEVGDEVKRGQPLVTMRSEKVSDAKLATLRKRREEAVRERDNTIDSAQRQLSATELKLKRIELQQAALARKQELLDLAHQQVAAAEKVLKKLQSISTNTVTSEFVGQLEIDRQRISLGDAKLNYQQQLELQLQAKEDLAFAKEAATEERTAAEAMLAAASASQALEILDLEIDALIEQVTASKVVASVDGVILAMNASAGETSMPLPLVEMANLKNLVCEIEINEMDAALVTEGQKATIVSRAFGTNVLSGVVDKKFKLVGRPQLRPLDPLARADYRTVIAVVKLDDKWAEAAAQWLQLQVEVTIDINSGPNRTNAQATTPEPTRVETSK